MLNTMKYLAFGIAVLLFSACNEHVDGPMFDVEPSPMVDTSITPFPAQEAALSKVEEYYLNATDNLEPSVSKGTPGNGSLENGKLMPFSGPNFQYFDTLSYLKGRAYTNAKTRDCILAAYQRLETEVPAHKFVVMECSHENGGKLWPHRTHQNGLSVDFMMPKLKDGKPFTELDTIGAAHYFLTFNKSGQWSEDQAVSINFDLVAQHILELHNVAGEHGLAIKKVIIKTELKDELYATPHGQVLEELEIYVVKSLTPKVNALHDDHYHVDFEEL